MLKRMCGWHKKYFGTEKVLGYKAGIDGITHGMCKACLVIWRKECKKDNVKGAK